MSITKTITKLNVEKRDIIGKKVANLRKQGFVPANIYGEDYKSTAIKLKLVDFVKLYRHLGETNVINLDLDKNDVPVLIHQVQKHPVSNAILHIDFRKVNLTKKIETEVPIKIIGESAVIKSNKGVLLVLTDMITIEALPNNIPSNIEIDISGLDIDMELKIRDLKKSADFTFTDSPDKTIVRITAHKEESVEVETQAPVTEVTAEVKTDKETAPETETAKEKEPKKTEVKPAPEDKK